ncbi:MAG: serine hydrolase [Anaerolineales bacterium]|nr:serine hydrolase [Anaerolineales bacterium]
MKTKLHFQLLIVVVLLLVGCSGVEDTGASPVPQQAEGWATSSPEAQGLDSAVLAEMLQEIDQNSYAIDSVVVVRNGNLVLEAYHAPFKASERHAMYSCTKSAVSALVGIAIEEGKIPNVETPIVELFPEREIANLDAGKQALTLEDVLTMSSGWDCRDSYLYEWEGIYEMDASGDWVQYILDLPMIYEPGTYFEYCNGGSHLLSALVTQATGMSALEYAHEKLFGPLGITSVEWPADAQGISVGYSTLKLTALDAAKFGSLYLNDGMWDGKQIVPAEWVAASTRKHITATLEDGYGYQWWVDDSGYYMALGYKGQLIFVLPEQQIVAVFVSTLDDRDFYIPQTLLETYVIPAVKSTEPLPENPEALESLDAAVQALTE